MIVITTLIGISFIGTIVAGNNLLKNSSEELQSLKLKDRLLREQQTALIKAKQDIEKYKDFEQIAKGVVPQDKDQAKAVREIVKLAEQSGIQLGSVTFSPSELGGGSSAPSSNTNQNPDAPNANTQSPSTSTKSPVTQAKPVENVPGVYSLQMSIEPDTKKTQITYSQLIEFLQKLENNRRTAQITQIKIEPSISDPPSPYLDFSITLNIFVKP